jgi:SAM-dependent methyltransferase
MFKPTGLAGRPDPAMDALKEPLDATLARWREESSQLDRIGVYEWLASRVNGQRVLEIGCGYGASTAALVKAGKVVFALDNRMDCLEATREKIPHATYGLADVSHYDHQLVDDLKTFAPDAVVCWLAGAPAESLPKDVPPAYAVMQHRLTLQQSVVRLAAVLETVMSVHLADRTAFPWKMKDTGRQTLVRMMTSAVIADTPFSLSEGDVHFRKLDLPLSQVASGTLAGVVPVIGEATLKRRHNLS